MSSSVSLLRHASLKKQCVLSNTQTVLTENKGGKNCVFRAQRCTKREARIFHEKLLYD